MLADKRFWVGMMLAYGIAVFFPPQKLFGMGGKKNPGSGI